jgi:hypothetical protein
MIIHAMEVNKKIASKTHFAMLSDLQEAACVLLPQCFSILLSLRELIRQGYLFGASILLRPLAERAAILMYLHENTDAISIWKMGWSMKDAPSFSQMLISLNTEHKGDKDFWKKALSPYNDIIHGKPDSTIWNTTTLMPGLSGYAPSKILNNNRLCDEICGIAVPWAISVVAMANAYL